MPPRRTRRTRVATAVSVMMLSAVAPATAALGAPRATRSAAADLAAHLLATTAAGYTLSPRSGPVDGTSFALYAPSPSDARAWFRSADRQAGFAMAARMWEDPSGQNEIIELGFHFTDPARTAALAASYDRLFSSKVPARSGRFTVAHTDAQGYAISAAGTAHGAPVQLVRVVVLASGAYGAVVEANTLSGPANLDPIPANTASRLAATQFRLFGGNPRRAGTGAWVLWLRDVGAALALSAIGGFLAWRAELHHRLAPTLSSLRRRRLPLTTGPPAQTPPRAAPASRPTASSSWPERVSAL